jgi:serpin B
VKEEYTSTLKENYRAEVNRGLDKQEMNNWVKENTNGKIEKIVKNVGPLDRLFLINAVYFNGKWKKKFDKSDTSEENFSTSSGKVKVSMMSQKEKFGFHKSENYKVARFPYGRNKVAMYILLPDRNKNLQQVMKNLTTKELEKASEDAQSKKPELRVKVPKFKTEYSRNLNQDLKSLGMKKAFTEKSNFRGISNKGDLYISSIRHKTFIKVDEKGTEAAAATSVKFESVSANITPRFEVDRPFLFFIRDDRSGTNLFVGKISNPNN